MNKEINEQKHVCTKIENPGVGRPHYTQGPANTKDSIYTYW